MGITNEIGETAGQIWRTLSTDGPLTLAQLKRKLNGQGELVNFAIGWLAREDKVEITEDKKAVRVQLK